MKIQLNSWFIRVGFAIVVLATPSARAFRFVPISATLAPNGAGASATFTVENDGSERVALQAETLTREIDQFGVETRKPTKDLSVYPPQMSLQPGEKRNIRLTWAGDRDFQDERAYRLIVSQVPVDLKKEELSKPGGQIKFLLQYIASIYVAPAQAASKISVDGFELKSDKLKIVFKNSGSAHRVLTGARIFLSTSVESKAIDAASKAEPATSDTSSEAKIELTGNEINDFRSENILAHHIREATFQISSEVMKKIASSPGAVKLHNVEIVFDKP